VGLLLLLGLCWFGGVGDGVGGVFLLLLLFVLRVGGVGVGILLLVVGGRGRYGGFFLLLLVRGIGRYGRFLLVRPRIGVQFFLLVLVVPRIHISFQLCRLFACIRTCIFLVVPITPFLLTPFLSI